MRGLGCLVVCSRNLHPNFNKQIFETIKNTLWRTDLPTIDSRCNATWHRVESNGRMKWMRRIQRTYARERRNIYFCTAKIQYTLLQLQNARADGYQCHNNRRVRTLYIFGIWMILAYANRKNVTKYSLAILIASQSINRQIEWISNKFCFMCSNHLWFISKRAKRGRATVREYTTVDHRTSEWSEIYKQKYGSNCTEYTFRTLRENAAQFRAVFGYCMSLSRSLNWFRITLDCELYQL